MMHSQLEFNEILRSAEALLLDKLKRLETFARSKTVQLFGYGTRGRALAFQLNDIGVNPVVFDTDAEKRKQAVFDGYESVPAIDATLPLVVSAAQNQSVLIRSNPGAFSLVECQFAFNFTNQRDLAADFTRDACRERDAAYAIYRLLHGVSKETYLSILCFRASLDLRFIKSTRLPLSSMWRLPVGHLPLHSFCDVGAYDGDTIEVMCNEADVTDVLAIEPNGDLEAPIRAVARKYDVNLHYFKGAAWSSKCKLKAVPLSGGMVAVEEDVEGDIDADRLDSLATRAYDYVKFDVEGAEELSMNGAGRTLSTAKAIAIAGYHRAADIFKIPQKLAAVSWVTRERPRAAPAHLYFQHYSECFDDSIFYRF